MKLDVFFIYQISFNLKLKISEKVIFLSLFSCFSQIIITFA